METGSQMYKITLPDGVCEAERGAQLRMLLSSHYGYDGTEKTNEAYHDYLCGRGIVGALVDGQEVELGHRIASDCTVKPLSIDDPAGRHIVRRSSACLMQAIVRRDHPGVTLEIGQSLNSLMFFDVYGTEDIAGLAESLDKALQAEIAANTNFDTREAPVSAIRRLIDDPTGDKQEILRGWVGARFGMVTVLGYNDLALGPFVPSAAFLKGMRIVGIPEGIMLVWEPIEKPEEKLRTFLLNAARQAREWNRRMNVDTLGKLNKCILDGKGQTLVQVAEIMHEQYIGKIASAIASRPEVKMVFVAGPSSSGKTSFVRRLSTQLNAIGKDTIYVGMDDYYKSPDQYPLDENGNRDYESIDALNTPRMNEDLKSLLAGRETEIPRYDFTQQRTAPPDPSRRIMLGKDSILLLEGIHGLNPKVTDAVPPENRFCVYVSAMPQLRLDESNRVPTTTARLLRRIVRDRRYRGYKAEVTISRWPSVRRGEDKYIFPNQTRADAVFNSSLAYELAVFRSYAWPYLLEVPEESPCYPQARNMLSFLSLVVPMQPDWIPHNSVLREFLGGSTYIY